MLLSHGESQDNRQADARWWEHSADPAFVAYWCYPSTHRAANGRQVPVIERWPYSARTLQRRYEFGRDVPPWFTPTQPAENANLPPSEVTETTADPQPESGVEQQPASMPEQAALDPELARLAIRRGEARPFWLWCIARALDRRGAGWVYLDDLLAAASAQDDRLSERQFARAVRAGASLRFWTRSRQRRRGERDFRRRLYYASYARLAERLTDPDNTNLPGERQVVVPLRWETFEAHCYAAWLTARIHARRGHREELPISRQSLGDLFGVSVPTLLQWEASADIRAVPNYVQTHETTPGDDVPAHATVYQTAGGALRPTWRTVNSYVPPSMEVKDSKRTRLTVRRRCRATVNDSACSEGQPLRVCGAAVRRDGEGPPAPFERRYFDDPTPADGFRSVKSYELHSPRARSGTARLVHIGSSFRKGAQVWELVTRYRQRTVVGEQDWRAMCSKRFRQTQRAYAAGYAAL